jgi:hypothetical protein
MFALSRRLFRPLCVHAVGQRDVHSVDAVTFQHSIVAVESLWNLVLVSKGLRPSPVTTRNSGKLPASGLPQGGDESGLGNLGGTENAPADGRVHVVSLLVYQIWYRLRYSEQSYELAHVAGVAFSYV